MATMQLASFYNGLVTVSITHDDDPRPNGTYRCRSATVVNGRDRDVTLNVILDGVPVSFTFPANTTTTRNLPANRLSLVSDGDGGLYFDQTLTIAPG